MLPWRSIAAQEENDESRFRSVDVCGRLLPYGLPVGWCWVEYGGGSARIRSTRAIHHESGRRREPVHSINCRSDSRSR